MYILPDAKIKNKTYFKSAQTAIKNHLYRNEELELFYNPSLKLYSRVDESREQFETRCQQEADNNVDKEADKLRVVLVKKLDRINTSIEKAEDKIREAQFDAQSRKSDQRTSQMLDIAGGLLGGLLGGRTSTRTITGGIRRSQSKGRMAQKSAERLKTAENRYSELLNDREELTNEVREDLYEIQDEWAQKATDIETTVVGLEKTDISIDDVALVWIPVD